ncbi:vWA domain-containing protein [Alteribacter aurantiacus]|uniref:vWA domain-containing protein n=1 Tax=Alteribacter aurantiacus TaxID=254410 RepID=UPI0004181A5C|nr:VWA domain-containing protein [Alteribacter aurantiacus]
MKKGTLRQVLLLTDGCSNAGGDPVAIAALMKEQGITVNVIGILEESQHGEHGLNEVEQIASSGGGISQIVYAKQLSQTVQMVTRKAMTQTIQGVVNKELQQILGEEHELEDLSPAKRGQVVEVVDDLGETMDLEVLILVDTSASMTKKLPMVQEALIDLSVSLRSRTGANQFSLYSFPGKRQDVEKRLGWTPHLDSLSGVFKKLTPGGLTPTGPALQEALHIFYKRMDRIEVERDERTDLEETGM